MNRKILVISLIVFGVLLCVTSIIGVRFLSVKVGNKEAVELFVYHDEAYDKVVNDLVEKGVSVKDIRFLVRFLSLEVWIME